MMSSDGDQVRSSGRRPHEEDDMPRYLLIVDYRPGDVPEPMYEWKPAEIRAHLDYYAALNRELTESGELAGGEALTGPAQGSPPCTPGRPRPRTPTGRRSWPSTACSSG
jgi:hypothetical protein